MKTYLITYDLHKPTAYDDYKKLHEAIKKMSWWHCLESVWIVKSNSSAEQIKNALLPYIDKNDELLVIRVMREAAWYGFEKQCADWLVNNLSDY